MGLAKTGQPARPGIDRVRRLAIWAIVIAIIWSPTVVAIAMLLTGHAGR